MERPRVLHTVARAGERNPERDRDVPRFRAAIMNQCALNATEPLELDGIGRASSRARLRTLSHLPQHHRRRRARVAGYAQRRIPIDVHELASGTPVFDWTVPKEWNIRDAYIANAAGRVWWTSHVQPARAQLQRARARANDAGELRTPVHHSGAPEWIPYRTSYYQPAWGFCLTPLATGRWPTASTK